MTIVDAKESERPESRRRLARGKAVVPLANFSERIIMNFACWNVLRVIGTAVAVILAAQPVRSEAKNIHITASIE
jgi:hypothetical protein